ncbi:MAG: diacylglycerol kinase family protein [Chloroflexota bacterium]|nr:diacylglycerol kinase family protein [Chloroflexota bacterium]
MLSFIRSTIRAIGFAVEGWWYVLRTQSNAWVHALISIAVIIVCLWLQLPARDWAVIILTIAIVWAAESFNTAVETLTDLVSPEKHKLAKISKDASAAAVLISAAASIIIGILIIAPPLWKKIASLLR